MNEVSDHQLIQRYRSGDAAAFDCLYERYRPQVFNYLYRQLRQQHAAEDLYQDVWIKIINSIEQFKLDGNFTAWIFKIARNRLIDYWRQQKPDEIFPEEDIEDTSAVPEHIQFIRSCIERLMDLLNTLKPEQREVFVLQQESGLTLEQIAQLADCGRETIKSRLRYAMKKIRQGLEGCDE